MTYKLNEILNLTQQLHLQELVDTNACMIEGMKAVGEKLNILVLTTHNVIAKSYIKDNLKLSMSSITRVYPCEIDIIYDADFKFTVKTEIGKINVDETTFVKQLSHKKNGIWHAKIHQQQKKLEKFNISFLYINDFSDLSFNEWILKLSGIDKIYYILDGLQIFNEYEKKFIDNVIYKLFSLKRMTFIVGNSSYLNEKEKKEILEYAKSITIQGANILVSSNNKEPFDLLDDDICELGGNTLEIRKLLEPDITHFATITMLDAIPKLKKELICISSNIEHSISLLSENSQAIEDRKVHIQHKIESFINDYVYIQFEKKVNEFNRALRNSLSGDIKESQNINKDSEWINKYMEYVWTKFIENQEIWLKCSILDEINNIELLVNKDLNTIIEQMDAHSQKLIKDFVYTKYNVHSYLIGKEGHTDIGELSKTMKLGSFVLAIFAPIAALLTFGGSELVKKLFKNKIDEGKKEHIILAVEKMSKQMDEQILQQAKIQFNSIASKLKVQVIAMYDKLYAELVEMLNSKNINKTEYTKILSLIDNIEK